MKKNILFTIVLLMVFVGPTVTHASTVKSSIGTMENSFSFAPSNDFTFIAKIVDCVMFVMGVYYIPLDIATRFVEDLGFDELNMLELCFTINEEFRFDISYDSVEWKAIKTFLDLVILVDYLLHLE